MSSVPPKEMNCLYEEQSASKNMAALINEATLITTQVLKKKINRSLVTHLNGTTAPREAVQGAARMTESGLSLVQRDVTQK